jgi:hypothetical protein
MTTALRNQFGSNSKPIVIAKCSSSYISGPCPDGTRILTSSKVTHSNIIPVKISLTSVFFVKPFKYFKSISKKITLYLLAFAPLIQKSQNTNVRTALSRAFCWYQKQSKGTQFGRVRVWLHPYIHTNTYLNILDCEHSTK